MYWFLKDYMAIIPGRSSACELYFILDDTTRINSGQQCATGESTGVATAATDESTRVASAADLLGEDGAVVSRHARVDDALADTAEDALLQQHRAT